MSPIPANLQAVNARIQDALKSRASAHPHQVTLVAVSKKQPTEAIRTAFAAGQRAFGENYAQEGVAKTRALADLAIEWHYIGPIQSNKAKLIARNFHWVHGIDRLRIAEALSKRRGETLPPLQVCIQVNVSGEHSKSGCTAEEAFILAPQVAALANIRLRGLMTIIEDVTDPVLQRAQFEKLRLIAERIAAAGIALDTLSMGMTQDFEAAIAEGATLVRIGTAIFGART